MEQTPIQYNLAPGQSQEIPINSEGLSIFKAWLFIVGQMAGIGAMVYPSAIFDLVFSFSLLFVIGAIAMFSGLKLSQSWVEVSKNPKYRRQTQNCKEPYPVLANIAFGKAGSWISRISCLATFFFIACIFLIMASQIIVKVFDCFGYSAGCACDIMIYLTIFVTPFTWLPSPKNAWIIANIGVFCAFTAFVFVTWEAFVEGNSGIANGGQAIELVNAVIGEECCGLINNQTESFTKAWFDLPLVTGSVSLDQFIKLLSLYIFGFGGLSIFPTIQVDMKKSSEFNKVVIYSITTVCSLYALISYAGYVNFIELQSNVILNLDPKMTYTMLANALMGIKIIMALIILTNPVNQALEDWILSGEKGVKGEEVNDNNNDLLLETYGRVANPSDLKNQLDEDQETYQTNNTVELLICGQTLTFSNKKAIILRTSYMCFILLFCYSVPKFDPIMQFIGATTVMTNSFILPSLIYIKIVGKVESIFDLKAIFRKVKTLDVLIILMVLLTGSFGSFYTLYSMAMGKTGEMDTPPCWMNYAKACMKLSGEVSGH